MSLAIGLLVTAGAAAEEPPAPAARKDLALVAEHSNGIREGLVVRYLGFSEAHQWRNGERNTVQTRGPKIKVHSPNTLKCGWKVEAWVERRAFYVLQSGLEAPIPGFDKRIPVAQGASRPDKGLFGRMFSDDERCDAGGEAYTREAAKAERTLGAEFEAFVAEDWQGAHADLQALVRAERLVSR